MPTTNPHVIVLRAPGTNCDKETSFAFERAGATVRSVHVRELLSSPAILNEQQILCLPGGFSYGDDIASGRILGNQLRERLADALFGFRDAGRLILGICNGFQVLMKTGLLDIDDADGPQATLAWNDSGRYEARWVRLAVRPSDCVFLSGLDKVDMPVAHAEGKFLVRDQQVLDELESAGRLVLRYMNTDSPTAVTLTPITPYPANPNGASADIAGICDTTGRVLGLMPHPERFIEPHQHPQWTRRPEIATGDGLRVFKNAVAYFR
jgi:phosphoribosylformylglycinamidine synthase I